MGQIISLLVDGGFLFAAAMAVAVAAVALTVTAPLLAKNDLAQRKKRMAVERTEIRARARAELDASGGGRVSLRSEPRAYMKKIVDDLKLRERLLGEDMRYKLAQSGSRGESAVIQYLFMRLVTPFILFMIAVIYLFGVDKFDQPALVRLGIAGAIGAVGFWVPDLIVKNKIQKRQTSIRMAWPDALDLMLICVESGMSIEVAFKKVADEIAVQSVPLAEELALCNAELSYLNDRRKAYENLGRRTGLESVNAVMTSLIQADRYGTPVGQALRVLAQESRDMRMAEAEKKAAGLPPKLTVPMIVFFLPALFIVIIGPAVIQVMAVD
ncbi:MAG: type II secretion system F family protein [Hyphomicrobiaceae bacterium]|nr:type II secretion system F family protein [Hyphomicrobiaceae bacterium]